MYNISSAAQQFNNNKKLKLKKPSIKKKKVDLKKKIASGTLGKPAYGAAQLGGMSKKKKPMSSY